MRLLEAPPQRRLKHRREIDVQVSSRCNGTWEVDATVISVKTRDALLTGAVGAAGCRLTTCCCGWSSTSA